MASTEGRSLQLRSLVDAPNSPLKAGTHIQRKFAQFLSVQFARSKVRSNERRTHLSTLQETMAFERSSKGENDLLKPCTRAEDLLVLGARALIVIASDRRRFPRGKLVASSYSAAFPSS